MCKRLVLHGTCTRCQVSQVWSDLTQDLPCLDAKNNGLFASCENGAVIEYVPFDQQCDLCADDEGHDMEAGFDDLEIDEDVVGQQDQQGNGDKGPQAPVGHPGVKGGSGVTKGKKKAQAPATRDRTRQRKKHKTDDA